METTDPYPKVFLGADINVTFGGGGAVVFFFGSGAFGTFWVVFVHGAEPFGWEFTCIYYSSEASPLNIHDNIESESQDKSRLEL